MKADNQDDATQARWRYEVRGSGLYDLREGRPVSVFEAGEILNAHEALLLKEGVWAAKAGLTQGKLDAAEATLSRLRAALEEQRLQLRWAWAHLGCRCAFDSEHNKTVEDAHCPVHGWQADGPVMGDPEGWPALLNESTNDPQEVK